jgi:hypothetical protein
MPLLVKRCCRKCIWLTRPGMSSRRKLADARFPRHTLKQVSARVSHQDWGRGSGPSPSSGARYLSLGKFGSPRGRKVLLYCLSLLKRRSNFLTRLPRSHETAGRESKSSHPRSRHSRFQLALSASASVLSYSDTRWYHFPGRYQGCRRLAP